MTWFAAHVITYIKKISKEFGVIYENIYLVEGSSDKEALVEAERLGRAEQTDDPTLTIDDEPASIRFVGVRKIVRVSNDPPLDQDQDRPISGSEITFIRYEITDENKLSELILQKPTNVTIIE